MLSGHAAGARALARLELGDGGPASAGARWQPERATVSPLLVAAPLRVEAGC